MENTSFLTRRHDPRRLYCLVKGPLAIRRTGQPSIDSGMVTPASEWLASRWTASTNCPLESFSTPTPHTPGCRSTQAECFLLISFAVCSVTITSNIIQLHAKVTPNAVSTSSMWLAMEWLLDPAHRSATAVLVPRSRINDPESPSALKEPPLIPVMMICS